MSQQNFGSGSTPESDESVNGPLESTSEVPPPMNNPLENAVQSWRRRGYTLRYDDGLLAQLTRRKAPGWRTLALVLLALGAFGLGVALLRLAWRSWRRWSVVSLTQGPDQRIITHHQLTNRPLEDSSQEEH
ncbi:MAG TPA: hypothetical protein VKQ36_08235 [Ktedonobacterales bacterium]|nr:hypothetical protein [Ktedonobacterales bacterium]